MQEVEVLVRLAATCDRRTIAGTDPRIATDDHRRELIDAAIAARRCRFWGARRVGDAILGMIERGRSGDRIFASINESHTAMHTLLYRRDYRQSDTILNLIRTIRSWCL